ncbi:ABC transporter ATP-binding protein [Microbacterium sp.]|uniref:ABC transporter ATP-binding protein n=1 Tax=Microbacterium sp. TaxID=51671 RepID=UPI003A841265
MTTALSVRGGSRTIGGAQVLHDIDLTVTPGETIAVIGRSGSGKSTLLSCVGLVSPFDRGTRFDIAGRNAMHLSDRRAAVLRASAIGFVLQNSGLVPHLSAIENVALPLMHSSRLRYRDIRRRARDKLDALGIGHLEKRAPARISGGERQRVAIARALVIDPKIILADEPTGALDEITGEAVLGQMLGVVRDAHAALIVVTHDRDVAARMDRTMHMLDGRLSSHGEHVA